MSETLRERIYCAAFWFALGLASPLVGIGLYRLAPAPVPVPAPAPITRPAPVHHSGHFTVSYIEPRYGSPTSAAVRDALAGTDWHALDATFRSYVDGQDELKTLGFVKHFTAADLPVLFIQETTPAGAPIIDTAKGPASAAAVLTRIKELRGN